jgi:hypothetical protein
MTPDEGLAAESMRANANGDYAKVLAPLIADGRLHVGVTCSGKSDGAGAQAMAVISAMALARFLNCRYVHTAFTSMAHAEGSREDWAQRWETFLNFGHGETPAGDDAEFVSLADLTNDPDAYTGRPIVIVERVFGLPKAHVARMRDALRPDLRTKYWRSSKAAIPSHRGPAGGLTVAIHVRRGDVNRTQNVNRYAPDEAVLRQIERLKRALAPFGGPLTLNLYSEGEEKDFRRFAEAGCRLHVSQDSFETFHNMVTADILLGGYSSFTYVAGILSEGIVLDHRVNTPQLTNWIARRHNRDLSIKRLRKALLKRLSWWERMAFRVRRFSPFRDTAA